MFSNNGALSALLGVFLFILAVFLAHCRDRYLAGAAPAPLLEGAGAVGTVHRVLRLPL